MSCRKCADGGGEGGMMRQELGCTGHFIAAANCHFRRHTQVEHYRISTVGDYWTPPSPFRDEKRKRETIGVNRFYETMVFRLTDKQSEGNEGCGCREVVDWSEVDFAGYNTAGEAQAGHEAMVAKWEGVAKMRK